MTREEWLQALVGKVGSWYPDLPTVQISVGFPSNGSRSKTIGQCWRAEASADQVPHIFIHPKIDDPVEVAGVVVHELIHACRPDAKHGPAFKQLATEIGLEGKMTTTTVSQDLAKQLKDICDALGPYPHGALVDMTQKKQSTRMLKCACPECGYTVRTTAKWLDVAVPVCPVCRDEDDDTPVEMEVG